MPIHDLSYRRYSGARRPHGRTWWVIAWAGIRTIARQPRFWVLLIFAWSPFIVRAVQIYITANFDQRSFVTTSADTFREFLNQQAMFVFFVTIYVGAGLIANDRRANALQVYLSRPLTGVEYVGGKLVTLLVFLVGVTWVPAVLLLLLQILFSGNLRSVEGNLRLLPAITSFSAIQVLVSAFAMLALSSLSKSARFVGTIYAGVICFTTATYAAVRALTGRSTLAWLSPLSALEIVGQTVFRSPSPREASTLTAFLSLAIVITASIVILVRRVRGVDVIK